MPFFWPNHSLRISVTLGTGIGAGITYPLSSSARRVAFVRNLDIGGQLTVLRCFITAVSGTLSANDILCRLHAPSTGSAELPGPPISTEVPLASAPSAGTFNHFDFSDQNITLQRGQRYWFVTRNVNAAPTTNNLTFYLGAQMYADAQTNRFSFGQTYASTDSGNTYAHQGTCNQAFSVVYTNDVGEGHSHGPTNVEGAACYGDSAYGIRFTLPPSVGIRVAAAAILVKFVGSPASPRLAIYHGSQLIDEANFTPPLPPGLDGVYVARFASPVPLVGGRTYRLVLKSNGDASNYLATGLSLNDTMFGNLQRLPLGSRYTGTTDGGSTWTDVDGYYPGHWTLFLDPDQPFLVPGGAPGFQYIM